MVSLIVPFIADTAESLEILQKCLVYARNRATTKDIELVLIDNGSDERLTEWPEFPHEVYVRNEKNIGVLKTFQQGFERATGDVLCFIHSDVLIHEQGWDYRLQEAFATNDKLGLAGFFGSRGTGTNGGRIGSMSHMLGAEWGKTDLQPAAIHHGELMTGIAPAAGLDGLAMVFSRACLADLDAASDIFDDWRAPHHFYDRIMSLKVIDKGYHEAVIGIQFDHWSGATANSSDKYRQTAIQWLYDHGFTPSDSPDQDVYQIAEKQFFAEFGDRLAVMVDDQYQYAWGVR